MAITNSGPLGPFKGRLGPLLGYTVRGKAVLRMKSHITKPRTEGQLATLQRMQVLSPFLNLIKVYLRVGFQLSAIINNNTPNNSAKSYNLKHAVKGIYPNQEIDYSKVRLSEGSLALPLNPQVALVPEGLKFTWDYDPYDVNDNGFDRTMLMAYFPDKKTCCYVISGALRSAAAETLLISSALVGLSAETYISFITDDRSSISNSVYTGQVVMV
jgi:hypothetical protein